MYAHELEAGRVACEAYREHSGGKSLITGQPIPPFEELPWAVQEAWAASAKAVCLRYGAIY